MRPRRGIEKEPRSAAPPPGAAFSDWLSGVGRSAKLRAHWLFGGEERDYGPHQAGLGAPVPAGRFRVEEAGSPPLGPGRWCWVVAR